MTFLKSNILLLTLLVLSGCGGAGKFKTPAPLPDDRRPAPEPAYRNINYVEDSVNKIATLRVKRIFDISGHFRKLFGIPRQAINVNTYDEVDNSSWFTNRNSLQPISLKAIARGPNNGTGPDTNDAWIILYAKTRGVIPELTIKDPRGEEYLLKFDPPGYPELATGAEVVSSRLFHAAGYNVPETYLVNFRREILQPGERAYYIDASGRKRKMSKADLDSILTRIHVNHHGRIRAVASKRLPGKPLGPFEYSGVRKDDINDIIPHQHRRELRGLKVMAAWLNYYDTKAANTRDVYLPDGYVRHYFLNFGATLGSNRYEPMPPEIGKEGPADPGQVFKTIGSFGAYIRPWEREIKIRYPSIGYFTKENFHPQNYQYILPNPAFMNATGRDEYWGAKLVMSFTDEQIGTAVAQAEYSDPQAAEYLARTLTSRRDIIGRYWFDKIPPLDDFKLHDRKSNLQFCFRDLAVEAGFTVADSSQYQYELRSGGQVVSQNKIAGNNPCIDLAQYDAIVSQPDPENSPEKLLHLRLRLSRNQGYDWSKWVNVFIKKSESSGRYELAGIKRKE